jgi:hypothetical protein
MREVRSILYRYIQRLTHPSEALEQPYAINTNTIPGFLRFEFFETCHFPDQEQQRVEVSVLLLLSYVSLPKVLLNVALQVEGWTQGSLSCSKVK